ncbi:DUF881 domain-containing protein [Actinoplanes sp. NPDC051411]|uniref:DUF881 domain-containing protein n=1 Tax=Actinoplanes sp. NPDC051411 TaxID=3155522 RepID=UPI003414586A
MSDRQEPDKAAPAEAVPSEDSPAVPPRLEMPTAGRRPASVTGPIGRPIPRTVTSSDDDEPTVATGSAADGSGLADEETRALSRPVAEETRALRRPLLDDGETRVLRSPSVAETPEDAETPEGAESASLSMAETLNLDDGPTVERVRPGATGAAEGAEPSPERVPGVKGIDDAAASGDGDRLVPEKAAEETGGKPPAKKKLTSAGALIWVLLLLLGYTLVVQLRSNNDDQGLATARQEDLVSILSDLESRDSRLQTEIQSLESSQRQLTSGVSSRQAALTEAEKRADELGLLAGTLAGKGPGLKITIDKVKASEILNAVQELRGSGGEVMELAGVDGAAVRIVASSYFVDAQGGGIDADGTRLTGPWTLWVIGSPQTMQTALQIPGGVVASINGAGGSVTMEAQTMVEVTAVRKAGSLQYAKPAS